MPHIEQLSPHVADLIAAGEVVERPASVVKELVENAVDAGAHMVTVEIQNGGMSLIRVTDDGCGIAPDELATAFLRHATSKIRTEYDLEAIGTLGFRGEALAAIAAVARVQVLTRRGEDPLGATLFIEGGEVLSQEEAGCPQGTTMLIRDLFFNTPARLKFMKKDAAEGAACFAAVQRQAMAHPEVSFKFIRDGKQELLTPGDGQLRSAMYAVLGRDLALGFAPVTATGDDIGVSGFVSLPIRLLLRIFLFLLGILISRFIFSWIFLFRTVLPRLILSGHDDRSLPGIDIILIFNSIIAFANHLLSQSIPSCRIFPGDHYLYLGCDLRTGIDVLCLSVRKPHGYLIRA